jgi:hypothetical protein
MFLGRDIDDYMPAIIKVFNMAYREFTQLYGDKKFEDIPGLDESFRKWRNIAMLETNPLAQYIESEHIVRDDKEKGIQYWMSLDAFQTGYRTTMKLQKRAAPWSETVYKSVFNRTGYRLWYARMVYGGSKAFAYAISEITRHTDMICHKGQLMRNTRNSLTEKPKKRTRKPKSTPSHSKPHPCNRMQTCRPSRLPDRLCRLNRLCRLLSKLCRLLRRQARCHHHD